MTQHGNSDGIKQVGAIRVNDEDRKEATQEQSLAAPVAWIRSRCKHSSSSQSKDGDNQLSTGVAGALLDGVTFTDCARPLEGTCTCPFYGPSVRGAGRLLNEEVFLAQLHRRALLLNGECCCQGVGYLVCYRMNRYQRSVSLCVSVALNSAN